MFQKCIDIAMTSSKSSSDISNMNIRWTWFFRYSKFMRNMQNLPLERVMKLNFSWNNVTLCKSNKCMKRTFWKTSRGMGMLKKKKDLQNFLIQLFLWGDVTVDHTLSFQICREYLAGEILSPEEFEDFVDLYGEIIRKENSCNIQWTILRHKRNYPLSGIHEYNIKMLPTLED